MTKKTAPDVFSLMQTTNTEELIFKYDPATDLKFVLIKHSTLANKKVNGGIRMAGYENLQEALQDGIKLAEAMTLKNILYDLPWGGGKAVIVGKPPKTKKFLHKIGEFVESFRGDFQTTIDMGFTERDAEIISEKTHYIDSLDPKFKKGCLGSSAIGTGIGVVAGMKVASADVFGNSSLRGKTIAIQGLGRVGGTVANHILKEGGRVIGTDINSYNNRIFAKKGVKIVPPDKIYEQKCDVFAPCALGGILNTKTIRQLKCKIVCGGANNQLEHGKIGLSLAKRGILYIPDFVINGGGMLQSQCEYDHKNSKQAAIVVKKKVSGMVTLILKKSSQSKIAPFQVAEHLVQEKINKLKSANR